MTFTKENYELYKTLLKATTPQLKCLELSILEKHYKKVIKSQKFIYAEGNIPIALVAHMDTVWPQTPQVVFFDREQDAILTLGQGCGHDDRAGIYAINTIIKSGLRPTIILTDEEEIGGNGAEELIKKVVHPPKNLKYIIELDRQGKDDCVFYYCSNLDFIDYIKTFGFQKQEGSFTDISIICPAWGIAGVNLSVGYYYEHSAYEILLPHELLETIDKVIKMLNNPPKKKFEYVEDIPAFTDFCDLCGKPFMAYNFVPYINKLGTYSFACEDCASKKCGICKKCGGVFYTGGKNEEKCVCCLEEERAEKKCQKMNLKK